MMSAAEYVRTSQGSDWFVPDLEPVKGPPQLVLVFESPHVDELSHGIPVAGSAGKNALRFFLPDTHGGRSLGCYVADRLNSGRVAVVNVSSVPLQEAAFKTEQPPALSEGDWALLKRVRTSGAKRIATMRGEGTHELSAALVAGLRTRIEKLGLSPETRVVAAGRFAHRMVREISDDLGLHVLEVPHPSYNLWNRPANETKLKDLRRLFSSACPE